LSNNLGSVRLRGCDIYNIGYFFHANVVNMSEFLFLLLIGAVVFLVPAFILWRIIKRIVELKKRCLLAPIVGILSLTLAFYFFLIMVSLNKDASILDLLRNPRWYFFDYREFLFPLALGILPMVTTFLYGDRVFFHVFSKEKLILIPLLLLCAFPASLIGAGFYYGIFDVIPILGGENFSEAFFPLSDYPLGLFIFGSLLIAYCFSIFLFFSFFLPGKYKLLSWAIVVLILGSSMWVAESKPREMEKIISEAKTTGDITKCKSMVGKEGIEIKRYECFKEVAIVKKDESLCEKISIYVPQYPECYIQIALIKKDPTICGKIDYQWPREECYIEVAKIEKNPQLCGKIFFTGNRDKCYKEVATSKKDQTLCEKAGKYKQECYEYFGR